MSGRKLSLVELLVLLTVVAMVVAIIPERLLLSQQQKKLTHCASNLRGLGQAMYIYGQDGDFFPASGPPRKENDGAMVLFAKENRTKDPTSAAIPSPTVDLWKLIRAKNATRKQFICPLTKDKNDPAQDMPEDPVDVMRYYDFLGASNLSYAYQYQYDPDRKALGTSSAPIFPLMADANPYIKGGVKAALLDDRESEAAGNSLNHGKKRPSQNILFQDSHVSLEKSPDVGFAGQFNAAVKKSRGRDNCYTVHEKDKPVDPGSAAPTNTTCNLGDKSDACLVP